jgi:hypothetical protein
MKQPNNDRVRDAVHSHYDKTAERCCGEPVPKETDTCCATDVETKIEEITNRRQA